MTEDLKRLSWHRLIALQLLIGSFLIGICAYYFRIPEEEVQLVSSNQIYSDQAFGMPLQVAVQYPGLGTITIDDPKELLKLKQTFYELLITGKSENVQEASHFSLLGVMYYLDQAPVQFSLNSKAFHLQNEYVNSLNVSASIRKLQSLLIDKVMTEAIIGDAVNKPENEVYSLVEGQLIKLSADERATLATSIQNASRVIDYSPITMLDHQPQDHFVIQLNQEHSTTKHWLHMDVYSSEYFVVYDLLDETNHRAYFKIDSTK